MNFNEVTLIAKDQKVGGCDGCIFDDGDYVCNSPSIFTCTDYEREDKRTVIWVVKESGK